MQITPFFILMMVLALALAIFLDYKMVNRQREALQKEGKPLPPSRAIFLAGLFPIVLYMGTAVSAILMMVAPFGNLAPAGSTDNGSTLFITLLFGSAILATLIYWFFVSLGMLSWKVLTSNT